MPRTCLRLQPAEVHPICVYTVYAYHARARLCAPRAQLPCAPRTRRAIPRAARALRRGATRVLNCGQRNLRTGQKGRQEEHSFFHFSTLNTPFVLSAHPTSGGRAHDTPATDTFIDSCREPGTGRYFSRIIVRTGLINLEVVNDVMIRLTCNLSGRC